MVINNRKITWKYRFFIKNTSVSIIFWHVSRLNCGDHLEPKPLRRFQLPCKTHVDIIYRTLGAEIDMLSESLNESLLSCCAPCSCWPMTLLDCDRDLQAWTPSDHLWSSFVAPDAPQFPNQEPPRPQQLSLPDFLVMPHLEHTKLMILVAIGVYGNSWKK